MSRKYRNRLSPPSRWPASLNARMERAAIDVDFVDIMEVLGFHSPELDRVRRRAVRIYQRAVNQLTENEDYDDCDDYDDYDDYDDE